MKKRKSRDFFFFLKFHLHLVIKGQLANGNAILPSSMVPNNYMDHCIIMYIQGSPKKLDLFRIVKPMLLIVKGLCFNPHLHNSCHLG